MRRMERGVKLTSRALAQVALIWIKWSRGPDKRGSVDVENFLIVGDFYFAGAGGPRKQALAALFSTLIYARVLGMPLRARPTHIMHLRSIIL